MSERGRVSGILGTETESPGEGMIAETPLDATTGTVTHSSTAPNWKQLKEAREAAAKQKS
jgi:hypothetical protein